MRGRGLRRVVWWRCLGCGDRGGRVVPLLVGVRRRGRLWGWGLWWGTLRGGRWVGVRVTWSGCRRRALCGGLRRVGCLRVVLVGIRVLVRLWLWRALRLDWRRLHLLLLGLLGGRGRGAAALRGRRWTSWGGCRHGNGRLATHAPRLGTVGRVQVQHLVTDVCKQNN